MVFNAHVSDRQENPLNSSECPPTTEAAVAEVFNHLAKLDGFKAQIERLEKTVKAGEDVLRNNIRHMVEKGLLKPCVCYVLGKRGFAIHGSPEAPQILEFDVEVMCHTPPKREEDKIPF